MTWTGVFQRGGLWWLAPGAATLGPLSAARLGGGLRDAGSVTPLLLADGRPAIAWTDNDESEGGGRIHVAVAGAADAPEPSAPRVRVRGPARGRLEEGTLRLTVTCSAACDVRAMIGRHRDHGDALAQGAPARAAWSSRPARGGGSRC